MTPAAVPPRVLLVMPAQWPRALLRAALREVGYEAVGTRALSMAASRTTLDPARGPIRLVVLDQDAVSDADAPHLQRLRASGIPIVLLAPAARRVRPGPWLRVLRRPVSIEQLVRATESLVPLEPGARVPID